MPKKKIYEKKNNKLQRSEAIVPGPEIQGEPFWGLMNWANNNIQPKLLAYEGKSLIFRSEHEAKVFKINIKNKEVVIRGINKNLLQHITKDLNSQFLMPLCHVISTKHSLIPVSGKELRSYVENNKFHDNELQKMIEDYDELAEEFCEKHKNIVLDETFESLIKKNRMLENKFENLEELFGKYRDIIIKNALSHFDELKIKKNEANNNSQIYTQSFCISEYEVEISWLIDEVKEIIKKSKIKECSIKISSIIGCVDKTNIVNEYIPLNNEPIIIADIEGLGSSLLVIDGNHRLNMCHMNGEKEISAYILNPKEHIMAMASQLDRNQYKILNNMHMIDRYITNLIKLEELKLYDVK